MTESYYFELPALFFKVPFTSPTKLEVNSSLQNLNEQLADPLFPMKLAAAYPSLSFQFFCERKKQIIENLFRYHLNANWFFFRIEFQSRGSAHLHGICSLSGDPGCMEIADSFKQFTLILEKLFYNLKLEDRELFHINELDSLTTFFMLDCREKNFKVLKDKLVFENYADNLTTAIESTLGQEPPDDNPLLSREKGWKTFAQLQKIFQIHSRYLKNILPQTQLTMPLWLS